MELKIKDQFKGQLITRNFIGRGKVIVDTSKEYNQTQLKNLYDGGFSDILEYIEVKKLTIDYKGIDESNKKEDELPKKKDESKLSEAKEQAKNYKKDGK